LVSATAMKARRFWKSMGGSKAGLGLYNQM